jgi:uncharacterized protein with HEPN domain
LRADDDRFADMLDAADAIGRFISGKKRSDLDDEVLFWALVAQVAMLGEAASRVTEESRLRYPEIPWREIVGMRNQLVHGYWSIDPDELWRTIQRDIPVLVEALSRPNT